MENSKRLFLKNTIFSWLTDYFKKDEMVKYYVKEIVSDVYTNMYEDIDNFSYYFDNKTEDVDVLINLIKQYSIYIPPRIKGYKLQKYFLNNKRDWIQSKGKFKLFDFVLSNMVKLPNDTFKYKKLWTKHIKGEDYLQFYYEYGFNNVSHLNKDEEVSHILYLNGSNNILINSSLFSGIDFTNTSISFHFKPINEMGYSFYEYLFHFVTGNESNGISLYIEWEDTDVQTEIELNPKNYIYYNKPSYYTLYFKYNGTSTKINTYYRNEFDEFEFISIGMSFYSDKIIIVAKEESEKIYDIETTIEVPYSGFSAYFPYVMLGSYNDGYNTSYYFTGFITKFKIFKKAMFVPQLLKSWEKDTNYYNMLKALYPLSFDTKDVLNVNADFVSSDPCYKPIHNNKYYPTPHLHIEVDLNKIVDVYDIAIPDLAYYSKPLIPDVLNSSILVNSQKRISLWSGLKETYQKSLILIINSFKYNGFGSIIIKGETSFSTIYEKVDISKEGVYYIKTIFVNILNIEGFGRFKFCVMYIDD